MNIDSFGGVMSRVAPGTFVPDMAPAVKSEPLDDTGTGGITAVEAVDGAGPSFKDTVKSFLGDVNDKLTAADQKSADLATGKSNDLEGTVKAVEESGLAMQLTLAMRNKLMDAYTEISRMQF